VSVVRLAGASKIHEQFQNRPLRHASHSTGCPDAVSFNQGRHHSGSFLDREDIHD
jgi:hypothetical protein